MLLVFRQTDTKSNGDKVSDLEHWSILEYLGLEFHGISILQSRSLEDLFCHFTVGQG